MKSPRPPRYGLNSSAVHRGRRHSTPDPASGLGWNVDLHAHFRRQHRRPGLNPSGTVPVETDLTPACPDRLPEPRFNIPGIAPVPGSLMPTAEPKASVPVGFRNPVGPPSEACTGSSVAGFAGRRQEALFPCRRAGRCACCGNVPEQPGQDRRNRCASRRPFTDAGGLLRFRVRRIRRETALPCRGPSRPDRLQDPAPSSPPQTGR